jgi:hypothetical protein
MEAELAALDAACPIDIMKFTLTFDGELPASGNSPKPKDKWEIRRQFQPQLAELWEVSPVLRRVSHAQVPIDGGGYWTIEQHHSVPAKIAKQDGMRYLCEPIPVGGHHFVPLIRDSLALLCGLEILFLRKEEPGALVKQGGDLDNRIKTLFDALRMPKADEMLLWNDDPDPFHCEDDTLISDYSIRSGRLLTRPGSNEKEVRLGPRLIKSTIRVLRQDRRKRDSCAPACRIVLRCA